MNDTHTHTHTHNLRRAFAVDAGVFWNSRQVEWRAFVPKQSWVNVSPGDCFPQFRSRC